MKTMIISRENEVTVWWSKYEIYKYLTRYECENEVMSKAERWVIIAR